MPSRDEKQTYSVDEMMDRLREEDRDKQSRDEGELVVREDGTQAIRIKKRKRRSKQEKTALAKRKKQLGILKVLCLVLIPLVLGLALLLRTVSYRSGTFADNVNATVSERVGGNSKVARLSPLVNQVTAHSVAIAWPDGHLLEQLTLSKLSGDLNVASFVTGKLQGEVIEAEEGRLIFSRREGRNVSLPKRGEALSLPGFKRYLSDDFSLHFGRAGSLFRIMGSEARFESKGFAQQLTLKDGQVFAGNWGTLPLKRALLEVQDRSVAVKSFNFENELLQVGLSGTLGLNQPKQILAMEVAEADIASLAGEEMGAFFEGSLKGGSGTLTFDSWNFASHEIVLDSPVEYLLVKNFAFLRTLEEFYGESRYQRIEFENERGFQITRGRNWVEVKDFYVAEIGVLGLRGTVRVDGGVLSGDLWVGLPDHKRLVVRSEQRDNLLSHAKLEDGFYWLKLKLSGKVADPKDDFLKYVEVNSQEATGVDLFEELTR